MRLFTSSPSRPWGRSRWNVPGIVLPLLFLGSASQAYQLDVDSKESIRRTASTMAEDMMSFYNGDKPGGTPGLLPNPYYWWEAGALMGALIDYWYYTGDSQYNAIASQGLLFQVGPNNDYMPPNQTMTEGNDDQGFWGMAVMSAAEYNFPDPPADKPQWLALAQAVFNTQAARWETADCNGGLRWQVFTWNQGYDYKNSISQACFFNIAARLALYTGNKTYADWAEKTWDWMRGVKLIDDNYYIYDGVHIADNCTKVVPYQFSYNAGSFLHGASAMYNYSSHIKDAEATAAWRENVDGLLNGTQVFFTGTKKNIMTEVACESVNMCDLDQQSFKAYLSRWMAATTKWAPFTTNRVMPLLRASAKAAARLCTGGSNGRMCGLKWNVQTYDGTTGVGQQMAAMEVTLANMIDLVTAPVTNSTGGTSQGDPNAGGSDVGRTDPYTTVDMMAPITAGDRAGAAILTFVVLACLLAGTLFLMIDETVERTQKERISDVVYAVGHSSKKLTKRGGHGIGFLGGSGKDNTAYFGGMSEKKMGTSQTPESFKVLDRSNSDFGPHDRTMSMSEKAPNSPRGVHARDYSIATTMSSDTENGAGTRGSRGSITKPFVPAHVRASRSLSASSTPSIPASSVPNAAAQPPPPPTAASTKHHRKHRSRISDPGQSTSLPGAIPENATVANDSADQPQKKSKRRSLMKSM